MANALIARFGETVSLERKAAGDYSTSTGVFASGSTTTTSITAVVQSLEAADAQLMAAGAENAAGVVIYTETALVAHDEAAKTVADVITYQSKRWVVKSVERWGQVAAVAHYKAVAMLEDVG